MTNMPTFFFPPSSLPSPPPSLTPHPSPLYPSQALQDGDFATGLAEEHNAVPSTTAGKDAAGGGNARKFNLCSLIRRKGVYFRSHIYILYVYHTSRERESTVSLVTIEVTELTLFG